MTDLGPWITTYSGKRFYILHPSVESLDIEDIAHSLAFSCRFNGHVSRFYSTAEHSYYVSRLVPQELALDGLLHDAAEAYTGDIVSPVKWLLSDFKKIESRIEQEISRKFGVRFPIPAEVKKADLIMLSTEARDITKAPRPVDWNQGIPPLESLRVQGLSAEKAEKLFLDRFYELTSPSR